VTASGGAIASESTSYLLDALRRMLVEDRSKEVGETVEIVTKAKKLFVYGVGRSGLAARAFAMRMVQLGIDCYFIGETITPVVSPGDAVLIVSNTGSTMSALQVANIARRVGAKVVSVTGGRTSKLAHASNVVLCVQEDHDAQRARLAPLGTLFEDATLLLLDGVVAQVMERLGQTEADMRGRHAIMV
jgi:6-phospho-3-hexuloisomerase